MKKKVSTTNGIRLQKYLAECGIDSRRKCEEIITAGRVTINATTVTTLGTRILPGKDTVSVDGKIALPPPKEYILFHKPVGYIVTRSDPHNPSTIYSVLPEKYHTLFPVGRLDKNSEGLLVLTNDGDFANLLMHPKYHVDKEYIVEVRGSPTVSDLQRLRNGIHIEERKTAPAEVRLVNQANGTAILNVILRQGMKRQIRIMFNLIGCKVVSLKRIRIGSVELGSLKPGQTRLMTKRELEGLRKMVAVQGVEPRTLRI